MTIATTPTKKATNITLSTDVLTEAKPAFNQASR
jgi:hypothetical protein